MNLQNKVTEIKGVGPKKSVALHKINIESIEDFLFFYPRDYEDRREVRTILSLCDGDTALVKGKLILKVKGRGRIPRKQTLKLFVQDETGGMEVVFLLISGCRVLAGDQIPSYPPSSGGTILIGDEDPFSMLNSGRMVLGRIYGPI